MKKRIFILLLALAVIIAALPLAAGAANAVTVTIFHTNDVHGSFLPADGVIDASMVKGMVNTVPGALLADAGDNVQGNAFATFDSGESVVRVMSAMGYDASAVGNHEFDYGQTRLFELASMADFPYLSANTSRDGKPLLSGTTYASGEKTNNGSWTIAESNGMKIAFVGITTPNTTDKTSPKNVAGLDFLETAEELASRADECAAEARAAGADAVVGLFHVGGESGGMSTVAVAKYITGLDAIIDGHSHEVYDEEMNGISVAQTGTAGANLGRIDLTFENGALTGVACSMLSYDDVAAASEPDAEVAEMIGELRENISEKLSVTVGSTDLTLQGGTVDGIKIARSRETLLGDAYADAIRAEAVASFAGHRIYDGIPVVGLVNGGSLRASIEPGEVTKEQLLNVNPFGNYTIYKLMTAKELYAAIENGVSKVVDYDAETNTVTGGAGCFPQVSGMTFSYDPTLPAGSRVNRIILAGDAHVLARDGRSVIVATNDYLASGGDGYTMFDGRPTIGGGSVVFDLVCDYFAANSPVNPVGGRVMIDTNVYRADVFKTAA